MSLHRHIAVAGNATLDVREGKRRAVRHRLAARFVRRSPSNMEKTAKQELVRRCAELMGREQLAARLGVSTALLEAWIRGDVTMPNGQLLPLAASLNQLAGKACQGS